jgi:hypothetical protein
MHRKLMAAICMRRGTALSDGWRAATHLGDLLHDLH